MDAWWKNGAVSFFYSSNLSFDYIYSSCYVIIHLLSFMRNLTIRWSIYDLDKDLFYRLCKPRALISSAVISFDKLNNDITIVYLLSSNIWTLFFNCLWQLDLLPFCDMQWRPIMDTIYQVNFLLHLLEM